MRFQNTLAFLILDFFKKAGPAYSRIKLSPNHIFLTPPNLSGTAPSTSAPMIFYKNENKSSSLRKIIPFVPILIAILINATSLQAGAKTWTGSSSTDWEEASNWSPASLPSSNDNITIKNVASENYPILSSGSYDIATLNIKSTATLTINNGTLNVSKQINVKNGGTLTHNDGLLTTLKILIQSTGIYNQLGGTLKSNKKLKNEGTFTSTGGTVQFTGSGDGGSDFATGSTQFFNVIIDDVVNPNFDTKGGGYIKIGGNFTNNNPDLDIIKATFNFNGTGDQTIYSASTPVPSNTTFGNLVIDKPSGTIQLLSEVAVENTYTEENGTLDHNGNIFWVGGSPNPVELSSFSAVILENGIKLKWRTETEINNYGFEIERVLSDSQNLIWKKIEFVDGHGNSNSPKDYSFSDMNLTVGKYYYRLKQIDTDGKFEYSKVIEIDLGAVMNYELSQNYPNPFNPTTTIRFSVTESSSINLSIYNSLGEKIEELVNEVKEPGVHTVEFNAESATRQLASGTYIYRLQANDFLQIKKMILLK
jgi:hypothetical protein